jgi:hypothetical protein
MSKNQFSQMTSVFWKNIESRIQEAVVAKELSQKGVLFLNNPQQKKSFQQWIKPYFSNTIFSLKISSSYTFFSEIKKDILSEFKTLGLDEQVANIYSQCFIEETIAYIKEHNPEVYTNYQLSRIQVTLESLNETVTLLAKDSFSGQTIDEFNQYLLDSTQNPSLGLDFFEVDDSGFATQLLSLLHKDFFYVKYFDQEEAVGCTLNTIKQINKDRKVLVIKSLDTWNKIPQEICNYILLADFYSDSIKAIEGNTCIFFTNESQINASSIELKKRKYAFLQKKLENAGASIDRSKEIMKRSSGFFFIIWHEVFHGKNEIFDEYKNYSNEIVPLLLFPYWSENNLDFEMIKQEYGKDARQLQKTISIFQQGTHPLLLKKDYYGKTSFQLTNMETIWEKFYYLIDSSTFSEYCDSCIQILAQRQSSTFISKSKSESIGAFSNEFKKGFLRAINLCINFFHCDWYQISDSFVKATLEKAKESGNELDVLDQYSYELAGISPNSFLDFLENNMDFIKQLSLGANSQPNGLLTKPLIVTISLALNEIISFDGYEERVEDLCLEINSWKIDCGNCNPNPRSIIANCFIPWFNYSGLSVNSRINLELKYLNKYKNDFWQILLDALQLRSGPAISNTLTYRKQKKDYSVTSKEYDGFRNKSINVLSDYGDCLQNSTLILLSSSLFPSIESLNSILNKIKEKQKGCGDKELLLLGNKLREFVFDIQFYQRRYFLDKRSFISEISDVVNNLSYKKRIYKYLFPFCFNPYNFPIKNPTPFDKNKGSLNQFRLEKKNYLLEIRKEMQEEGFSIEDLIIGVDELPPDIVVGNKADILSDMTDGKFEDAVFLALLNHNDISDAISYERKTTKDDIFTMELAKQYSKNPEVAGKLLKGTTNFDKSFFDQLHSCFSIETKKVFWDSLDISFNSKEEFELALHSISEVNNEDSFFSFFLNNYQFVLPGTLFKSILGEYDRNPNALITTRFEIGKVLDFYKGKIEDEKSLLLQASSIEIKFHYPFYYTTILFAKYPKEYAKLISFFYTKDDGSENMNINKKRASLCFSIYYTVRFCPGYQNNKFDSPSFYSWINGFSKGMQEYVISSHTNSVIWHLLCFSPNGSDGLPLADTIRQYIEENYTKELASSFITEEINKRGGYSDDGGDNTRLLGENYISIGKKFKEQELKYCSKLFTAIGDCFLNDADLERKQAENNDW